MTFFIGGECKNCGTELWEHSPCDNVCPPPSQRPAGFVPLTEEQQLALDAIGPDVHDLLASVRVGDIGAQRSVLERIDARRGRCPAICPPGMIASGEQCVRRCRDGHGSATDPHSAERDGCGGSMWSDGFAGFPK